MDREIFWQGNFVPFVVDGTEPPGLRIVSVPASEYSAAEWSIRHLATQKGKKVWGMGSGFFEYEFAWPKDIDSDAVGSLEFRAELASRYPQEKYLEEGVAEGIGMTIVTDKGTTPGYGQNSYLQTDEKTHSTEAIISANGNKITELILEDDPADHRGILSWMNQERDGLGQSRQEQEMAA
ncbi:MAG: hypothetical protein IPI69_04900 [Bacteroidales bacterium]|nr:hypothetical protein [Bacteroidales bacterium]